MTNKLQKKFNSINHIFILSIKLSSTEVNIIVPNDTDLNCKELSVKIIKANQYADKIYQIKKLANLTT
jgi:hypothetical protein|tara:strand:+ start:216 stop:419 length:204 start_codon:yes stop_codon:yes gene_type:complete